VRATHRRTIADLEHRRMRAAPVCAGSVGACGRPVEAATRAVGFSAIRSIRWIIKATSHSGLQAGWLKTYSSIRCWFPVQSASSASRTCFDASVGAGAVASDARSIATCSANRVPDDGFETAG
jgi:hypothetical protein